MGGTGTTASAPESSAACTRRNTSGGVRHPAASWTSTRSAAPICFKASCADTVRPFPPATAVIGISEFIRAITETIPSRARKRKSSGVATTTVVATPEEMIVARVRANTLRMCSRTTAFGSPPRRRAPDPAAGMVTQVIRMRALRPAGPLPRTLPSSRPARARRRGSDGPWRACASLRSTGRDPARGARGRGRPRRP